MPPENGSFMRLLSRACVLLAWFAAASVMFAQQDMTAEWKASVIDLERRMHGRTDADDSAVEEWRADAEALRFSLVLFAESRSDIPLHLPQPLDERPS